MLPLVLGEVEKCEISKEETMIVGGKGCKKAMQLAFNIDAQIKDASNDYEKQACHTQSQAARRCCCYLCWRFNRTRNEAEKQMFEDS